jgi:hypothetical protein
MHCVDCGESLPTAAARVCPRCGAPVTATPPTLPTAATRPATRRESAGVPADHYVPSQYGPPVVSERSPYTMARPIEIPRVRRPIGYRPIVPPPPPPQRRRAGCTGVALLCLALVVLAAVAVALASGKGTWQLGAFGAHSAFVPTSTPVRPTATAAPACPSVPVDGSAAAHLSHVQMTTALRDAARQDYRPLDNVTTFHPGHHAYITFQLATAAAGTVDVTFCTPHGNTLGTLRVPPGSSGRFGEFSTALDTADVGTGIAALSWNGSVAAVVRFTVSP